MTTRKKETSGDYQGFHWRKRNDRGTFQLELGISTKEKGARDGKRKRNVKSFSTFQALKDHVDAVGRNEEKVGIMARTISPEHLSDAVKAIEILSGRSTLEEAAQFFVSAKFPDGMYWSVEDLVKAYEQNLKDQQARPVAIASFKMRAKMFRKTFEKDSLRMVTKERLESWLNENEWHGHNRRNYIAALRALFNFAIKHKRIDSNPADLIPLPKVSDGTRPQIMTAGQVATLLHRAEEKKPWLVPGLAIAFFCGVRPFELKRLSWSNIRLSDSEPLIRIDAAMAKTRFQRIVHISPNCARWLLPYANAEGKVISTRFQRQAQKLAEKAKLKIPFDGPRHCFASYSLVRSGPDKTATEMGHKGAYLLLSTYKGLVTESEAAEFWDILPAKEMKLLRFRKVG